MLTLCIFLSISVAIQAQMEGFVVGGSVTSIQRHPHAALLTINCHENYISHFICGSTILNQMILLTAAHCVIRCEFETRITISLGSSHREYGELMSASKYIWHKEFDVNTLDNDIGLVKLPHPVKFSASIARVAIMRAPPYNEPAIVAGWGYTNIKTKAQSICLKELHNKVLNRDDCQRVIGTLGRGSFCASSRYRGNHTAPGDSGSGLVVRGYIQIGLVSGYDLKDINIGIYTDVGYFYDWITHHAHDLYCGV